MIFATFIKAILHWMVCCLSYHIHLKSRLVGNSWLVPVPTTPEPHKPLLLRDFGKTFQNLKVSSPAPVTIEEPSGDIAR